MAVREFMQVRELISLAKPESPKPREEPSAGGLVSNMRLVSLLTVVSRVFGLLRDTGMAAAFGGSTILDTFILAFRIPNLARQLFGEGALSTAFLPVFLQAQRERGDSAARETLSAMAVALGVFLSLGVLCAEAVLFAALAFTMPAESTRLLWLLLMLLLPYTVLICLAALCCAALHARRIFFWPAIVPILLNVLWLAALGVTSLLGLQDLQQAVWMAVSVLVAGVAQMLLPMIILRRRGLGFTSDWRNGWPAVQRVGHTILPVVLGMAVVQISAVLDSLLAWSLSIPDDGSSAPCELLGIAPFLPAGTTAALFLGQRLYQFPLGVFGVALGTVLYPVLTQHALVGDMQALRNDLVKGLRIVIAVALPASVGLVLLSGPISTALFQHGEFNAADAQLTSWMIAVYGAGTWSAISLAIANRAFYATGDRKTPMRLGLWSLAINLTLNLLLVRSLGGIGLALGSVIGCIVQLACSALLLSKRVGGIPWKDLRPTLLKGLAACAVMGAACAIVQQWMPPPVGAWEKLVGLGLPLMTGVASYWLTARLLKMSEIQELLRKNA